MADPVKKPQEFSKYVEKTAEARLTKLDKNLTKAVLSVLEQKGWNRQKLSKKSGIPHSTLSLVMGDTDQTRSWNLRLLLRLAVVFGVKLSDLILAAETFDGTPLVTIHLAGTEPRSRDRLAKIIRCAAPGGTPPEVLDSFYNVPMMELAAPGYVAGYLAGKPTDQEVYELLSEVHASLEPGDNVWVKLASVLREEGNSPTT